MSRRADRRSLTDMKKRLFISGLVLGIIVLALGGWTVKGIRRVLTGSSRRPAAVGHGAWRPAAAY